MKTKTLLTIVLLTISTGIFAQLHIQGFYMEYEKTINLIISYKGYEDKILILEDVANNQWKTIDTIASNEKGYTIVHPQMGARYKCITNNDSEISNVLYFTTKQVFTCTMIEKIDTRTQMKEGLLYIQANKKTYIGELPQETFIITIKEHIIKYALFDGKGNIIASMDNEKKLADMIQDISVTKAFEEKIQKVNEMNNFLQGLKSIEFTTDFLPNGSYMLEVYMDQGPFESQKKSTVFKIQH